MLFKSQSGTSKLVILVTSFLNELSENSLYIIPALF